MAFNLNKLVQPECGAPNPLVATAQQIAMRPSGSSSAAAAHFHPNAQKQIAANLTKEFLQQEHQTIALSKLLQNQMSIRPMGEQSSQLPASSIMTANQMLFHQPQQQPFQMLNHAPTNSYTNHQFQSAADRLETKYRDDMISSSSQQTRKELGGGRVDDIEFWQSLSQRYVGPTPVDRTREELDSIQTSSDQLSSVTAQSETLEALLTGSDNLTFEEPTPMSASEIRQKNEADLDYVFDERNPLKDQFSDPFAEGLKALDQGDIPSAALLFEAAVQKDTKNALAWRYLGTTQAQNEKDMSAIRALRNCLALDPTDQQARIAIAPSLVNETLHHEACKNLIEWLINHEKYQVVGASLEKFRLLDQELSDDPFYVNSVHQKHYSYVRDKFVEAARLSPQNPDPEVQNSLGVLFNMSGEYDKAVDCFKAALSVKSDDSLLWNRLGATLANGNKSDEAVGAYRKALEISPGFLRSRYNLAISLIHLNIYDEAAKQLVQILNMQAAGQTSRNAQIRARSITSTSIWNTLRTVATLLNKPDLYPLIDGRDLGKCNELLLPGNKQPGANSAN